jgi:hypothetical protein
MSGCCCATIEIRTLGRLGPYPHGTPHAHRSPIAASIVELGWTNPILVAPDGIIISGSPAAVICR